MQSVERTFSLCCYWLNAFYCAVIGRFYVRRKSRDRKSGKQKHFNFYEYLNGFANQQTLPKKRDLLHISKCTIMGYIMR